MFQEIEKYKSLDFFAHQVVEGFITGLHRSPNHGFSVEFAEHRLYNSGESTRNIDWKLYARTDKLFVKRFEEETNLRCQILIDNSSSMLFPLEGHGNFKNPNKLTFSAYAAALIIELLSRQRDAYGLTFFNEKIELQTEVRSNSLHQHYLYGLLSEILTPLKEVDIPQKRTSIAESLHLIAERMHRRSMVVIFTDAFINPQETEALFDALRHLRHMKHEVLLFHVFDLEKELKLNFGNKPFHFIDMETDKKVKVFPNEIAENYSKQMLQMQSNIKHHAIQYQIDYIPIDIQKGFDQVMQPYLLKRSKHH